MSEPATHIINYRPVRAATAARLNRILATHPRQDHGGSCSLTLGRQSFERDTKGNWKRKLTGRNPAYWDRDIANVICDAGAKDMLMLFVRFPRRVAPQSIIVPAINRLTRRVWAKGLSTKGIVIEYVDLTHWRKTKLGERYSYNPKTGEFEPHKKR